MAIAADFARFSWADKQFAGIPQKSAARATRRSLQTRSVVKEELNALTNDIIGAAIEVHRVIGPGALESTYETCLSCEFVQRGMPFERQKPLPMVYRGWTLDCGYRIDLIVAGKVIVELKSVERLEPVHKAQVISHLRLSGCHVGLLINFNVKWLVDGIKRIVNDFPD
jgi:GxxExxY protein